MRDLVPQIKARFSVCALLGVPEGTKEVRCLHPEKHAHGDEHFSSTVYEDRVHCHACNSGEDVIGIYALKHGITCAEAVPRMAAELGLVQPSSKITATYDYRRADGTLAFQVVRLEPGKDGRSKDFRQRRPMHDGSAGRADGGPWAWGLSAGMYRQGQDGDLRPAKDGTVALPAVERTIYRLPELMAAPADAWVFVVEGEKDVETLRGWGLTATCNPGGAGKWLQGYGKLLQGRRVAVLPDNDLPGRKHAADVAESVPGARIVTLPDVPEKGDVTDWNGGAAALLALVEASPAYELPLPVDPSPPPLTDLGIADRFVARHGDDVRCAPSLKAWFLWDGCRWHQDATGEALDRMAAIAREETVRASDEPGELGAARKQESAPRIAGALTLAGVNRRIAIAPGAMDADPWLLSVRNGTLDLRTGALRQHAKADLISKLIDIPYTPDAPAPRFLRFLDEVMVGDAEMITFLRRWFGYCLTADTTEHVIVFFTGTGRNGKGVLVRAIKHVLGPMAATAPDGLLTVSRFERHPAELEVLRGRRLVIAIETSKDGCAFAEARIKQLTGGDDIAARGMRENFTELVPTAKILVQANHQPKVNDDSLAFWERMRVVPFPVCFAGREDRGLDDALKAEAEGVLAWMVRGALEWREHRLPRPRKVTEATDAYRTREDVVGRWEADRIARGEAIADVIASALWSDFERWRKEEGDDSITQTAFGRELTRRGWTRDRTVNGIVRTHPKALLGGLNG